MSNAEDPSRQARSTDNRARLWVLFDANRLLIAGLLTLVLFLGLVLSGVFDPSTMAGSSDDPIDTAFQAFIGAVITGVTLVIAITQLALAQELGPIGNQRDRMDSSLQLQEGIEGVAGMVREPEPSTYLRLLCVGSRKRADTLGDAITGSNDETLRNRTDQLTDIVIQNASGIEDELSAGEFGRIEMIRAALNFNYSWKIYAIRRLQLEHANSLDEETEEAFEDLLEALELFGPTREYFKTQYIQWELVDLSRVIMYAAFPALAVAVVTLYHIDTSSLPSTTFGISNLNLVVSASTTVTVLPFLILIAYMPRVATISKRTGTTGPFILREAERLDVFDW